MKLYPNNLYHIYNRGNNKQKIFFTKKNYHFFLQKMKVELKPFSDIVCYCLMPNHFHFLISTYNNFDPLKLNLQEKRSGSLFQQNSKAKCLTALTNYKTNNYGLVCFNYIHQNPIKARLVNKLEDWEFSSFSDFRGLRNGTMCNKDTAYELLGIPFSKVEFDRFSNEALDPVKLQKIF